MTLFKRSIDILFFSKNNVIKIQNIVKNEILKEFNINIYIKSIDVLSVMRQVMNEGLQDIETMNIRAAMYILNEFRVFNNDKKFYSNMNKNYKNIKKFYFNIDNINSVDLNSLKIDNRLSRNHLNFYYTYGLNFK